MAKAILPSKARIAQRQCSKCKQNLPVSEFYTVHGELRWRICKECWRKKRRDYEKAKVSLPRPDDIGQKRNCSRCRRTLPLAKFSWRKKRGYFSTYCRICESDDARKWRAGNPEKSKASVRRSTILRRYSITEEEFEKMYKKQKGVCAICGDPEKSGRRIAIDHCHTTKKVRGLLCYNCNVCLGWAERVGVKMIMAYLKGQYSLSRMPVRGGAAVINV